MKLMMLVMKQMRTNSALRNDMFCFIQTNHWLLLFVDYQESSYKEDAWRRISAGKISDNSSEEKNKDVA